MIGAVTRAERIEDRVRAIPPGWVRTYADIDPSAPRVVGRVHAAHVIINGEVSGPIESHQLLELQPKARVVGDIRYEALEMHQGAQVDGELRPLKAGERPSLVLAASNDTRNGTPDEAPQAKSA